MTQEIKTAFSTQNPHMHVKTWECLECFLDFLAKKNEPLMGMASIKILFSLTRLVRDTTCTTVVLLTASPLHLVPLTGDCVPDACQAVSGFFYVPY